MSALPPKADIDERDCHVRFVPIADIHERSVGQSLVSDSFEMKICVRDCRNTLSLYLTARKAGVNVSVASKTLGGSLLPSEILRALKLQVVYLSK
jgi:hypothetical protein